MIKILRALYGDVIFTSPDESDTGTDKAARTGTIESIKSCGPEALERFINALIATGLEGDTMPETLLVNTDGSPKTCGEVSTSSVITADSGMLFGTKANKAITEILKAIKDNDPIHNDHVAVINQSIFPVYSYLNLMNLRRGVHVTDEEKKVISQLLAASHAFFVLSTMHSDAAEVIRQARLFYVESLDIGPYSPDQALRALNDMDTKFTEVSLILTERMNGYRERFQTDLDRTVKYFQMRLAYQTIVAAEFAGR
jgi:hypothetical protein